MAETRKMKALALDGEGAPAAAFDIPRVRRTFRPGRPVVQPGAIRNV